MRARHACAHTFGILSGLLMRDLLLIDRRNVRI
jgi:hypothetical protein